MSSIPTHSARYKVGGAFASGQPVTVSAAQIEAARGTSTDPTWVVLVYDEESQTGDSTADIGPISITGTPSTMPFELQLLIAPAPVNGSAGCSGGHAGLAFAPEFDYLPGARSMRNISLSPALAPITRVACADTRDIGAEGENETIVAAQVFHLKAAGVLDQDGEIVEGGNTFADVTGTLDYSDDVGRLFDAIGYVLAGNQVAGTVRAAAPRISRPTRRTATTASPA